MKSKVFTISFILLIIGGINWGLVGLFGFNLVSSIFGAMSILTRIIYIIVGAAAVVAAISHFSKS